MITYSSKSNAIRAARVQGLDRDAINCTAGADGRWSFAAVLTPELEPTPETPPAARGGKAALLLDLARSPEGVTNAQLRQASGWSKLGGFFDAAKRAGLMLHRCREHDDTRWFAANASAGQRLAYLANEDGQWQRFGAFESADHAAAFASAEAPEGTEIRVEAGKRGELYVIASGDR